MTAKLTPMMKQYLGVKDQHPDKIVFFRMGDFYEMFFDDAKEAARVLGIALTSRDKGKNPIPMAGVPYHAMETYLRKFIENGFKVVICDQVQDPAEAVGLVRREVTRIITPGTYLSEKSDDVKDNVFLGAICRNGTEAGFALTDLSTGEFFADRTTPAEALEEMAKMGVTECLVPDTGDGEYQEVAAELGLDRITAVPAWSFDFSPARDRLREHFGVASLQGFGFDDSRDDLSICAAGAALQYLYETQKNDLAHILKLTPLGRDDVVIVDRATQVNLELIRTQRAREKKGALYGVLDFTRTAMGSRKLRHFILRPLRDGRAIFERQEAVREFKENDFLREEVKEILGSIYDLERLTARVAVRRCNARDLVHLKNSLLAVDQLRAALNGVFSSRLIEMRDGLAHDGQVPDLIEKHIIDDPPLAITEAGIVREGINAELDDLRAIARDGKSWITAYQQQERERTGIDKLRVGYNKVFGYYLEATNLYKDRVPEDYIRKQTLRNSERFITPELKEYEGKVLSAEDRIKKIEYDIFQETREAVAGQVSEILRLAGLAAETDVYFALGTAAYTYGYTAPVVNDSAIIEIQGGSHPVLQASMPDGTFVPNDLFVDAEKEQFLIITGPNMSGKSTYIRQAAILVLMAQMGSFIPTQKATIGVVDRVFTRIGASDEISRGQSTFMVEMTEVANILNNATGRSFIILDEVGRGTSTFDGVSIAWAIAEYLMEHIKARTLFATHYHELTELALTCRRAHNLNVAVKEWNDKVVFLHKIIEGSADKSYGIHVADIAGLPETVIGRANEVLGNLELVSMGSDNRPRIAEKKQREPEPVQLSIFDMPSENVLKRLKTIEINSLTPLEALTLLNDLQRELG